MKKMAIVLAALAATGCGGKKSSGGMSISCNNTTNAYCWTAVGQSAAMTAGHWTAADCTAEPATVAASCSAVTRVGRCSGNQDTGSGQVAVVYSFYTAGWDVASAQATCVGTGAGQLGGTWTAG